MQAKKSHHTSQSLQKFVPSQWHRHSDIAMVRQATTERVAAYNSTSKKLAVQWLNEALFIA
jgi:hypothetical protein